MSLSLDAGPATTTPKRAVIHAKLLEQLRDLIVEGVLEGGARVPERVLCERFGVSRTPLREALKALAAEGLIELLPNRGARVAQPYHPRDCPSAWARPHHRHGSRRLSLIVQ